MSDIALRVEGLGKRYRLGIQDGASGGMYRYKSLRDSLGNWTRHPLRTARRSLVRGPMTDDNAFWALKDVGFEVKRGEVVGIIGRNGAGKSTLLKILSQITKPTTGRVDLFGRVGSLLEVGTGFHPELSGRENIYLNGAILGMTRAEVKSKFDEIVAFSEIEKFLDMAVKQYSSGMYTRLAFAVAAHLEPEILIVDEVLAVGDAEFQRKCMTKMHTVAEEGRTVLFVSHNMSATANLCRSGIVLASGEVAYAGLVRGAIEHYLTAVPPTTCLDRTRRRGTGEYRFESVALTKRVYGGAEEKIIAFHIRRHGTALRNVYLSAHVVDARGNVIAQYDSRLLNTWFVDPSMMDGELRFSTPWLKPGQYRLDLGICGHGVVDLYEGACEFDVGPVTPYGHPAPEEAMAFGLAFGDFAWTSN